MNSLISEQKMETPKNSSLDIAKLLALTTEKDQQSTPMEQLRSLTINNLEINAQAARALEVCKKSKDFVTTLQHAESERLLLLSSKSLFN